LIQASPVSGIAIGNNLPVNVQHSINDFYHQLGDLRHYDHKALYYRGIYLNVAISCALT